MRKPDFDNLLAVLNREVPDRPTLFEFFLNARLHEKLASLTPTPDGKPLEGYPLLVRAFANAGYDYVTTHASDYEFPYKEPPRGSTISLNAGAVIFDRASFEAYDWKDPDKADYSRLDEIAGLLPDGMRIAAYGPGGVLENVVFLLGYDNLSYLLVDDPELVEDVFAAVGSGLVRYYEICSPHPAVGAVISNDDWGFNKQTTLRPEDMRRYIFPWHKRIVETIHATGKPAILHSCGQLEQVMDDVIDDMGYDAKHSYEDKILPIEDAYERWGGRISMLGGIDVDFVCRSTPAKIVERSRAMLERTADRGGWALGTGNSVPEYVPDDHYLAMVSVINPEVLELCEYDGRGL